MAVQNRNISLRGLRTFCVAAGHESFRTAADELFITASAVSHQVKNLEQELGQKLFDRGNRTLRLTEAGQALYGDVYPLIEKINEVAGQFGRAKSRSKLSISVQPFFASEWFIPRLLEFTSEYPDIDIKVDTSDESSETHPIHSDASIRIFKVPPQNLTADSLFPLRLIAAGSPDFQRAMIVKRREVVSEFPIIVHDSRPRAWKQWESSAKILLPEILHTVRLDSMIAVVRAAERGLGAALVPARLSDSWFKSGALVRLFDEELETSDRYYLVSGRGNSSENNVRLFRNWVLQNFGERS